MRDIEQIRAECERRQAQATRQLEQALDRERRARELGNFRELVRAVDAVRAAEAHFYHVHA